MFLSWISFINIMGKMKIKVIVQYGVKILLGPSIF